MTKLDINGKAVSGFTVLYAAALFAVAALALSGCAAMREQEAAGTKELLATAGFQMRRADSPDHVRALASMRPFRLVERSRDGNVAYTFADPENCRCLYVGGPKEYSEFRRLATERQVAEGRRWAEDDAMDWGLLGGGWWGR